MIGETNSSTVHVIVLPPNHYRAYRDYVSELYRYVKDGKLSYADPERYPIEIYEPQSGLRIWNYIIFAGTKVGDIRLFVHLKRILKVWVKRESYESYLTKWESRYFHHYREPKLLVDYILSRVRTKEDLNILLNGILLIYHDVESKREQILKEIQNTLGEDFLVYDNGAYYVAINPKTGTKYRYTALWGTYFPEGLNGFAHTNYPESIDLNISYRCDVGCPYCYIDATPNGKELVWNEELKNTLLELFRDGSYGYYLPYYAEVSLNVNNLFDYGTLSKIIRILRWGKIPNVTLHYRTAVSHPELFALEGVYWTGVSVTSHRQIEHVRSLYPDRNIVFHVINGIFDGIEKVKNERILVLGYKTSGRGRTYSPRLWKWETVETLRENGNIVAMDDLAIKQLEARKHLPQSEWDRFFMGWDYTHSLFIDLVKGTFAENSYSSEQFPLYDEKGEIRGIRRIWYSLQFRRLYGKGDA